MFEKWQTLPNSVKSENTVLWHVMLFVLAETCVFGNVDKFLPDYTALRPRKVMLHRHRLNNLIPNVTLRDLVRIFNREF